MGNMSEEMKKVMAKWGADKEAAQNIAQPAEQSDATPARRVVFRNEIYETVNANPGITAVNVHEILTKRNLKQTLNSVSSQLTALHHDFMVRREAFTRPMGGRPIFQFYAVPPAEAAKLKAEHMRKLAQARARAERARQAKAEKLKQRQEELAAATATPKPHEQLGLPFNTPAEVAPAAPDLRSMSAMDILNAINLPQARELYTALKEAFGG